MIVDGINGGYFVLNKKIFDYINDDKTVWEDSPLTKLAKEKNLNAYKHDGFLAPNGYHER